MVFNMKIYLINCIPHCSRVPAVWLLTLVLTKSGSAEQVAGQSFSFCKFTNYMYRMFV